MGDRECASSSSLLVRQVFHDLVSLRYAKPVTSCGRPPDDQGERVGRHCNPTSQTLTLRTALRPRNRAQLTIPSFRDFVAASLEAMAA